MKRKSNLFSLAKSVLLALILVFVINTWFFKPVQVVGSSMYPTLEDGQQGFSSVIGLNTEGLQRFDVVVVATGKEYLVKRIIGLPNETIHFKDDELYINNELIQQPFLDNEYVNSGQNGVHFTANFGPLTLGTDEYFLMGDNRPVSIDSRYPQYGPFKKDAIISKDMLVLYPFNKIRWVGE